MDKPLSLKIMEFQQNLSKLISNSDLPIYILKYQIKDLYDEIDKLANDFSQREINEYYKSQEKQEEETPE